MESIFSRRSPGAAASDRTIAVLTDAYVDYQRSIIDIATDIFADSGYRTFCFAGGALEQPRQGQHNPAAGNEIFNLVEKCEIAGIIAFTGGLGRHVDQATLTRFLYRFDVPVLSIGVAIRGIPSIVAEDCQGMRDLMSHVLVHEDRQRIAFLRGIPADRYSVERERIFRESLSQAGRCIDEDLFPVGNYDTYDAYYATTKLLKSYPDVDTIIAANDQMALSAARAVSSMGLRIPEDVAITGFDDAREATEHSPALTTVRKPMLETAQTGARQLLDLISTSTNAASIKRPALVTQLSGKLVIRSSTPPAASGKTHTASDDLQHQLIQLMTGMDKPADVNLEPLANALIEWITTGSYSHLVDCVETIRKSCNDRLKAHWVRDLCRQIESLTEELLRELGRSEELTIIRGFLSPLLDVVWTRLLAQEFDSQRVGQARASLQVQIGACTQLEDMLNVLDDWLANVKPHRFYLVQYDQPAASIPTQARLIRAALDGQVIVYPTTSFVTASLLPAEAFLNTELSQLIFYPVHAGDQHHGYILIEALGLEQHYINEIALCLGNAMHGQFLIHSLKSQAAALKRSNNDLDRLAYYDTLTGLPNRRFFEQQVSIACERGNSSTATFAIAFLDLDGFKMVNDTLGHDSGDQLLKFVALRLRQCVTHLVGERGLVARLSGDEFTLLIQRANPQEMDNICINLLESLGNTYALGDHRISVSASIGYAFYPDDAVTSTSLLRCADTAMYDAKASGKNRHVRTNEKLIRKGTNTLSLAHDLRFALENDGLILHYQPRIDLHTRTLHSVEALTRWFKPPVNDRQLMASPAEFIPVAEKSGLVSRLDTQMLSEACRQARLWVDAGTPLTVSINVSVMQLQQTNFVAIVKKALEAHALDATLLELEITESAMMTDIEANIQKLKQLRSYGVQVSIDDFGTGYSSLSYLKRLPVSCLKVDRSFIKDIASEDGNGSIDATLVHAIVALAKSMNCSVVAEGIETEAQRRFAIDAGFDQGQGYFFERPQSAQAISALLQEELSDLA